MQQRNRTFGRVSRPVDKTSAPRQAVAKRRKLGRTKQTAVFLPKSQRSRETPLVATTLLPAMVANDEAIKSVAPAETPAVERAVASDEATSQDPVGAVESVVAADDAPSIDPPISSVAATFEPAVATPRHEVEAGEADPTPSIAVPAPELSIAMDPLARPMPPTRVRTAKRRPALRLAAAGSVAIACLLAFGRFSDAHLPAPAVVSPAASPSVSYATQPVGESLPQSAAFALLPNDVSVLLPVTATAAFGTDDLVEAATLSPTAGERVTARAVAAPEKADTPAARIATPKKPAPKQVVARNAAPRGQAEASRQRASRGPILDFLSDLIP